MAVNVKKVALFLGLTYQGNRTKIGSLRRVA